MILPLGKREKKAGAASFSPDPTGSRSNCGDEAFYDF
jgi:hypothetical protein